MTLQRIHGGPDALGVPRFDFSTNSNACGPCPIALSAVQQADAAHYPDASYATLRQQLAVFHGVETSRVLLAGSASEFIFRVTAWVAQQDAKTGKANRGKVCLPPHSYGDYGQAAQAWGLGQTTQPDAAQLVWACEPSSPLGGLHARWPCWLTEAAPSTDTRSMTVRPELAQGLADVLPAPLVLDRAYEPLRLSGTPTLGDTQLAQVWQLWTPNKALGLTGVRAAYAIAPQGASDSVAALERLCASWPVGAHGVAMLQAWVQPEVQVWLAASLHILRDWKARQSALLERLGWVCLPSDTPFFCARPAPGCNLIQLRAAGIKLRDTASFGLPGFVRVSVQAPQAQEALAVALQGH
ncbi:aminotransferase class I/II-fold pyridoxal phosphate-dependent enzyme [Rhodoferax ferrireducens]|uniref:aminotransferase class I/II-fold pyridoxal phosphate-dependent enzyme n=1 Tax=Rhodoferax ferrireducens TaxID=192843 RepID=UPI000E0DFA08|nr:aminotransferase class I/II-fold pyridoxal phosphate-dependent enzyme [Rhodoferax ferrireducens]